MTVKESGISVFGKALFQSKTLRHLALVVGWIVLSALGAALALGWSSSKAHELFKHRRHGEVLAREQQEHASLGAATLTFASNLKLTPEEQGRLKQQQLEARGRARFHLWAAVFIFSNYYLSAIMFSLTSALAAILLVFISKTGWKEANEYLVTLFLVTAATAVFYKAFPGLFMQEQSIEANRRHYLRYVALEDRILTYAATGAYPPVTVDSASDGTKDKTKTGVQPASVTKGRGMAVELDGRAFILLMDQELASDDIPIGIDHSKAPAYENAFQNLSTLSRSQ
ncbi:MAG TPA: hypothetical protein VE057_03860 [Archangium sp.]|nr:hypothetical protein [Archangium sp.]